MANYLSLPVTNSHNATTPDTAALDIVGDMEIMVRMSHDDWAAGTFRHVISKDTTGQRSYYIGLSNLAGGPMASRIDDGAAAQFETQAHTFSDDFNTVYWWKMTYRRISYRMQFFSSTDNTQDYTAVSWTQVGGDNTGADIGATNVGTALVALGTATAGSNPCGGRFYRGVILDGLAGSLVADFNADDFNVGDSDTATAVDTAGLTWTLNGANAEILSDSDSLSGLITNLAGPGMVLQTG